MSHKKLINTTINNQFHKFSSQRKSNAFRCISVTKKCALYCHFTHAILFDQYNGQSLLQQYHTIAPEASKERKFGMEQKLRRDRCMGDNLKQLRLEHQFSQEKLCAELQRRGCDIGRTTYEKYERGELNIRISVLIELKKLYQCSYDAFFYGLDTHSSDD